MLATNEKRLRWLGMDMRPRWRRRVAVVATYLGFLGLMGCWMVDDVGRSFTQEYPYWAFAGIIVTIVVWWRVGVLALADWKQRTKDEIAAADRWALWLLWLWPSGTAAAGFFDAAAKPKPAEPYDMVMCFLIVALLARTLPMARLLWTDADPREVGGEMALVAVESEA